ncbi:MULTISPECIES: GNAT family N-acetyltransferase [Tatumella]|uniref:GNAT family N-acetyltransferase n=1 Tax=Tatumella punctata TaxID=399969 RepID=A0ABW1VR08_9GAMM|nr:GNAT family N-acetyltransferase [Tatumella sp. JGM130]
MLIRSARPSDAEPLSLLAERTFRDTFQDGNTAQDMELHCRESYGKAIQLREIQTPGQVTLVCEDHGELAGYARLRWEEFPACINSQQAGEILCLYMDKQYHGSGLAHDLMRACLRELEQKGSDIAWLGVWEHNPRAISFYKKSGFTEAGEHIFQVGSDPQRDIIMMRTL